MVHLIVILQGSPRPSVFSLESWTAFKGRPYGATRADTAEAGFLILTHFDSIMLCIVYIVELSKGWLVEFGKMVIMARFLPALLTVPGTTILP